MAVELTSGRNVLGGPLRACAYDPLTGYFRDGCCRPHPQDNGKHLVCARMTQAFLEFSLSRGNDLITPRPEWRFPGLKPGARWCLSLHRWLEALEAGVAPPVVLECTHALVLDVVALEVLQAYALTGPQSSV